MVVFKKLCNECCLSLPRLGLDNYRLFVVIPTWKLGVEQVGPGERLGVINMGWIKLVRGYSRVLYTFLMFHKSPSSPWVPYLNFFPYIEELLKVRSRIWGQLL